MEGDAGNLLATAAPGRTYERMAIELTIQASPDDEPRKERYEGPVITIGRDPTSSIRFDMDSDLEVSTRHAEIRYEMGVYSILDRQSTNGTWVNGSRVHDRRSLHLGDVINLGRGPELRVSALDDKVWQPTVESKLKLGPLHKNPTWRPRKTREWLVTMVQTQTRALKIAIAGLVAGILVLGVAGWFYVRGLSADDAQVWREVTAPAIRKANDDAVALIETEIPGTLCARGCEGSGFAMTTDGLLVTNRHVVVQKGVRARTIRVKFANTRGWIPATFVRAARDTTVDLALIQVDQRGTYPAIGGVSTRGADLAVGSNVMIIGFPLGTLLRMEGSGATAMAKTTMTLGAVGKVLHDLVQVDALADHGSSGSPVLDRHGHAIGVVSGGSRESDKIVYVVPANRIWELVRDAGLDVKP